MCSIEDKINLFFISRGTLIYETSANIYYVSKTLKLIRKYDQIVYADSGYFGATEREEIKNDEVLALIVYYIKKRPSSLK